MLVTLSFGQQLQGDGESWSVATAWGGAVAASLLYFLSILLHEFGHSITSRLLGLPVVSITLFLFGGLARLSGEPRRPRDEFLIAVAGPATSAVLGLGFLVLTFALPEEGVARKISFYLGWLNLFLVAFNSIPGYPLDGGHVLRALLWHLTGSLEKATRWASAVGSVFARLLIGGGLALALLMREEGLVLGLLVAFVGWFLLRAARAGVMHQVVTRHLGRTRVGECLASDLPSVDAWTTVEEVAEGPILNEGRDFLFVTDGGAPRGTVDLRDVKDIAPSRRPFLRISQIMTVLEGRPTIDPGRSLLDALAMMDENGTRNLPVVADGQVIGILTRERLTRILHNRMSMESNGRVREEDPT